MISGDRYRIISEWTTKLGHFNSHVLLDVYPLSKSEYRLASLARRASYDYLLQIIEACLVVCKSYCALVSQIDRSSMHEVFVDAERVGVLPAPLGTDLAGLADLRNRVVHQNLRADRQLLLHDRLLDLTCAGIAAQHTFFTLAGPHERFSQRQRIIVDRDYIAALIRRSEKDSSRRAKALERLKREQRCPRYVIDPRQVSSFLRLANQSRLAGD